MRFCISFGVFKLKYLIYCILYFIFEIYIWFFIYYDENYNDNNKKSNGISNNAKNIGIFQKHKLLDSFCFILGYFLNFIPTWINYKISKTKEDNGLIKRKKALNIYITIHMTNIYQRVIK